MSINSSCVVSLKAFVDRFQSRFHAGQLHFNTKRPFITKHVFGLVYYYIPLYYNNFRLHYFVTPKPQKRSNEQRPNS